MVAIKTTTNKQTKNRQSLHNCSLSQRFHTTRAATTVTTLNDCTCWFSKDHCTLNKETLMPSLPRFCNNHQCQEANQLKQLSVIIVVGVDWKSKFLIYCCSIYKYTTSLDRHLSCPTNLLLTSVFCFNFSGIIICFCEKYIAQTESKSVERSDSTILKDTFEIVLFSKH